MSNKIKILALVGSLRKQSSNQWIMENIVSPSLPAQADLIQYTQLDKLPLFNEDLEADPDLFVKDFLSQAAQADAFLFVTPEYNAGPSAAIKNALDWGSRPTGKGVFANKPALVLGSSPTEYGAKWAQESLIKGLEIAGADVVSNEPLPIAESHHLYTDPEGFIQRYQQDIKSRLQLLVKKVELKEVVFV